MSVNMMAASLRCSVFSDGTDGLEQIVAGRKQQSVQGESGTLAYASHQAPRESGCAWQSLICWHVGKTNFDVTRLSFARRGLLKPEENQEAEKSVHFTAL